MEEDILIDEDGSIRFVYSDQLATVFADEERTTARASHVEPFGDGWIADMSPSGGPVLWDERRPKIRGHRLPFKTRQEALAAERAWLRRVKGL